MFAKIEKDHQLTLPTPTGTFASGITSFHLTDESRKELHDEGQASCREWMVNVWYPTNKNNAFKKTYSDGMASRIKSRLSQFWSIPIDTLNFLDQLDSLQTHTLGDALIYPQSTKFPVLFFSHGFGQSNFMYSSLIEEIVSYGYVIFAIEHTYSNLATKFPDGRIVENSDLSTPNKSIKEMKQLLNDELETWVKDVQFTCDQLEINSAIGNAFKDKLDLTKIGVFGHSFGGATAVDVCRQDPRFRAGLNMDGAIQGEDKIVDIKKPFMFLFGKAFSEKVKLDSELQAKWKVTEAELQETVDEFVADTRKLYQNLSDDGYYILLPEVDHGMFGDNMILGKNIPETLKGKLDPNRATVILRNLLVDFFNYYLLGPDQKLINDLSSMPSTEVIYETNLKM